MLSVPDLLFVRNTADRHQSMWDFLTGGVELNVNLSAQAMLGLNYPVQTLP